MSVAIVDRINAAVALSPVGTWFRLEGCGHPKERAGSKFTTELRAGLTTWAAMAYIISVNAAVLSDSGGTCVCPTNDLCIGDADYLACVEDVRRELITTTAAISALASGAMGLIANLPVGLAPGLGINAYVAYSVVGFHGSGSITYQEAMGAVFMEGILFFILSLLGVRQWMARLMPQSLVMAVGAGIGLAIAFIGLSPSGLGVVGGNTVSFVALGGCKAEYYVDGLPGYCASHVLQNPTVWLGIFVGGIFTLYLMMYQIRGAILIGILLVSIISWPRSTSVTAFPHTDTGDSAYDFFKEVVTFKPLKRVANVIDFGAYRKGGVWYALVTMLYVDILDTTGTLYSMAKFADLRDPVTLDFEGSTLAYCVDALTITIGSLLGTSPVTAFIESATGIAEGGKTGITAIVTGLMFFVSVFFAPIFASFPSWATGSALVIVGSLMIKNVSEINWNYMGDAVPAFLTIIITPFTFNIAYGVVAGIGSYILINSVPWILLKFSNGKISPPSLSAAEPWVVPPGGIIPPWIKKIMGRKDKPGQASDEMQMGPTPNASFVDLGRNSEARGSSDEQKIRIST